MKEHSTERALFKCPNEASFAVVIMLRLKLLLISDFFWPM